MTDESNLSPAERVRARMNQRKSASKRSKKRSERPSSSPTATATATATVSDAPSRAASAIETRELVFATQKEGVVRTESGELLEVPEGWALLEPGDAAITRRVKKKSSGYWVVKEKRGRKLFSRGVWAPAALIEQEQERRRAEVQTEAYKRKLEGSRRRAAKSQEEYIEEFTGSVRDFLRFHEAYQEMEAQLARVVSEHATPVGSGTVARTKRIPVEERAEAAVIAWMRHQTTAYDSMAIARVKGRRREVRRELAERSRELLEGYRRGSPPERSSCPLWRALQER